MQATFTPIIVTHMVAALAALGAVKPQTCAQPPGAARLGNRLFVPALLIPAITLIGTLGLKHAEWHGAPLFDSANTITLASASNAGVEVGPAAVTLTFAGCTVTLAAGALTLAYAPSEGAPPVSTIVLSAAGVAITGTAVTVNGIPIP
mgnify:CR=1 FL=1